MVIVLSSSEDNTINADGTSDTTARIAAQNVVKIINKHRVECSHESSNAMNNKDNVDGDSPPKNTPSSVSGTSNGSTKRRLTAHVGSTKKNPKANVDDVLSTHLGINDSDEKNGFKDLRV